MLRVSPEINNPTKEEKFPISWSIVSCQSNSKIGVEPMTAESEASVDPRVGRKVTWNIYGLQFVGTVRSAYSCTFSDGEEFLSVDVESENGRPHRYPGIPASIFPPGTPDKGNAQWVN